MADTFVPIDTQEKFDAAIQKRLDRERAKYSDYDTLKEKAGKYDEIAGKDYEKRLSDMRKELDAANGQVTSLTNRVNAAESALLKGKIAHEYKIPYELSGRLTGNTEDELRKDAETFAKYVSGIAAVPLASTEPAGQDAKNASLKAVLQRLNLKGET